MLYFLEPRAASPARTLLAFEARGFEMAATTTKVANATTLEGGFAPSSLLSPPPLKLYPGVGKPTPVSSATMAPPPGGGPVPEPPTGKRVTSSLGGAAVPVLIVLALLAFTSKG